MISKEWGERGEGEGDGWVGGVGVRVCRQTVLCGLAEAHKHGVNRNKRLRHKDYYNDRALFLDSSEKCC